jgi:sensor histidine kinase YesM
LPEKYPIINDKALKWTGIPFTGILVFYLSGFGKEGFSYNNTLVHWLYFILISCCLWNANVFSQYLLRRQLYKIKTIALRLPARFSITIIVSWLLSFLLLSSWNRWLAASRYDYNQIFVSQVIMTFISIQIGSIYEIVYLSKERESDLVKVERSEKLKAQAMLDALKSQIDPHFIFNSLNTLSYLIGFNPQKAKLFNDTLAKVYRYILINKEKDLISLNDEIEFASNYYYLLKIRYQSGLNMVIKMDDISGETNFLPPLSLQTLIENAIKHNHFSEKHPLQINITISSNEVKVVNNKSIKKFEIQSSKIGLVNLNERYKLTVNQHISIPQDPEHFTVLLPLLKTSVI